MYPAGPSPPGSLRRRWWGCRGLPAADLHRPAFRPAGPPGTAPRTARPGVVMLLPMVAFFLLSHRWFV